MSEVESVKGSTWKYENGKLYCTFETFLYNFELAFEEILDQRRWTTTYEQVVEVKTNDGIKYFKLIYDMASTECSGENQYGYDDQIEANEVFPKEVTTIVYE